MAYTFNYPNTPYYLPTTTSIDISINITGGSEPDPVIYKISSSSPNTTLPSGLSINPTTGAIRGTTTFTSISPLKQYIIDASSTTVSYSSNPVFILVDYTPIFEYPNTPYILIKNNNYSILPNYTFGNKIGITYSIISSPPLTDISLNLRTTDGTILGTPDISSNLTTYTIRANNNNVLYDATLQIAVEGLPTLTYPNDSYSLTQNEYVSIIPIETSSGTNPLHTISCTLPSGLSLNSQTGEIYGTPTILTTFYEYTITITNTVGSTSASIKISVVREFLSPPVFSCENIPSADFITNPDIQMRRKAEILQYKHNSSNLTKQQYLSLLAKGKGPYAKRAWATQGDAFTSSNTSGLTQLGNTLECNSKNRIICKPSSSSNVPGPVVDLCYNPDIKVMGYNQPNRQRINIGFKWPYKGGN